MDSLTGNLYWSSPQFIGPYDAAFRASQYDHDRFVCSVMRDMLFEFTYPNNASIETLTSDDILTLYPNPTSNRLNGSFSEVMGHTIFQIIDVDSRIIMQPVSVEQNHFDIDVSNIAAGIYFMTLQNENVRIVRKFVKE